MRYKRVILRMVGTIAVLIGLALGCGYFIFDGKGRPLCHNQLMISFGMLMHDSGEDSTRQPKSFPNVNGIGRDSLATLRKIMPDSYMDWAEDYRYVPGLQEDDPGDLVLMYYHCPTRWTWHAGTPFPPTIFKEKMWIIVPVDFLMGTRPPSGPGEKSERVSQEEFRRRLKRTLDFVRIKERPNWQTVVAEHTKFLDAMD